MVTLNQLVERLIQQVGSSPVSLVACTEVPIKKLKGGTKCELLKDGPLMKLTRVSCMINWIYENSVNLQRLREGLDPTFKSEPRMWGTRIHLNNYITPFVHHIKGLIQPSHRIITNLSQLPPSNELYLETKIQRIIVPENENNPIYLQNNQVLSNSKIAEFFVEWPEGLRQGVQKPVILRDYKLTSLRKLTIGQEVLEIDHSVDFPY